MSKYKITLIAAIFLVVILIAIAGFSYYFLNMNPTISGFTASATGTANLTVETSMEINFTTKTINWGSGKVESGRAYAILDSENTKVWGNWSNVNSPLVLENIGNVNVSLNLKSGKTNATFIGGTNPAYRWKVTNNEAGSCNGGGTLNSYLDVNTTSPGTRFCNQFGYLTSANAIDIDINLTIPYNSQLGALGDIITATSSTAI